MCRTCRARVYFWMTVAAWSLLRISFRWASSSLAYTAATRHIFNHAEASTAQQLNLIIIYLQPHCRKYSTTSHPCNRNLHPHGSKYSTTAQPYNHHLHPHGSKYSTTGQPYDHNLQPHHGKFSTIAQPYSCNLQPHHGKLITIHQPYNHNLEPHHSKYSTTSQPYNQSLQPNHSIHSTTGQPYSLQPYHSQHSTTGQPYNRSLQPHCSKHSTFHQPYNHRLQSHPTWSTIQSASSMRCHPTTGHCSYHKPLLLMSIMATPPLNRLNLHVAAAGEWMWVPLTHDSIAMYSYFILQCVYVA